MEEAIVRVEHLSHRYSVDWAIRDINLEVKSKGVFGLLGSNGAGKSTTMNIICGVLNQTEGNVWINNINLRENPVEAKKFIGFLPQRPPLYPDMTVEEYLCKSSSDGTHGDWESRRACYGSLRSNSFSFTSPA